MTEDTTSTSKSSARRRASRAAGPASGATAASTGVPVETPKSVKVLAGFVAWAAAHQRNEEADAAKDQMYVDTASQFVVNMFSYTQDTIDDSVDRFVNSTSGPLRDMMSLGENAENL